jgi:predicted restriction endonuclease
MLKNYLEKFAHLRTDSGRERYPATTCHRAPHKPLLLLAVMDHIAEGVITENFIRPTLDLVDTFNTFDEGLMSVGSGYEVLVSRQAKKDPNIPGPIMTFADRPIFRPSADIYWPSQKNFSWHREAVFK